MEGYLRGYYGYKNFGDELLFFGVVKQLFARYPLKKLFVEVGNVAWMEDWIRENYPGLLTEKELKNIKIVSGKQHRYRWITHIINFLGCGKYKKTFKFFGGGEVLSDERPFPHDGRNIPILFNESVRKRRFVLLGGIGNIKAPRTQRLYNYLLPKADAIILRDRQSYEIARSIVTKNKGEEHKELHNNVILFQDFGQEILENYAKTTHNNHKTISTPYILININKQSVDANNIQKIITFCATYPDHKKIFFPCDMNDDRHCFALLQTYIPDIQLYDWTRHTLSQTLSYFYHADGGIGARLHFLLPLKLYAKPIVAIPYADKINKLMLS